MLILSWQGLGNGRHSDAVSFLAWTPCSRPGSFHPTRQKARHGPNMVESALPGEPVELHDR
jgi:hypothetical protein